MSMSLLLLLNGRDTGGDGYGSQYLFIGDRNKIAGYVKTTSYAGYSMVQNRSEQRTGSWAAKDIKIIVPNFGLYVAGGTGEVGTGGLLDAQAAIEYGVTNTLATFSGNNTATIGDESFSVSDKLSLEIPANTDYERRFAADLSRATSWYQGTNDQDSFFANGLGTASNKVSGTGSITGGTSLSPFGYGCAPFVVGRLEEGAKSFLILGDSIGQGIGDGTATVFDADDDINTGDFSSVGANVSIAASKASFASATTAIEYIETTLSSYPVSGYSYRITIIVDGYLSGDIDIKVDDVLIGSMGITADGTKDITFTESASTGTGAFKFVAKGTTTLNISDIRIRMIDAPSYEDAGMYERALRDIGGESANFINCSVAGEYLQNMATTGRNGNRLALAAYATHAIIALGTNDFGGTPALSTMTTYLDTVISGLKAINPNIKIGVSTILPRTISWADTTEFSASYSSGGTKDQFNAYIRGLGTIDAVIDIAAALENPIDTTEWLGQSSGGLVLSEGTHPSITGINKALPVIRDAF